MPTTNVINMKSKKPLNEKTMIAYSNRATTDVEVLYLYDSHELIMGFSFLI